MEATTTWAGPMAGCVLADYGADVIKIEHPDGEVIRRLPPVIPDSTNTIANETVNRNKRNLSLELRSESGRGLFLDLCRTADIVIENFRPGTLDKWGIGFKDVRAVKPDIVFVSISGYGQFGELSDRVGYDPVAQNYSGFSSLNGSPEGGPVKAPTFLGDDLAGLHGAMAAMAALRHRDQTGEGQHVDVALVDSLLFQSDGLPTAGALGVDLPRVLTELMACTELADLDLAARIQNREQFDGLLAEWCSTRTVAEVVDTFAGLSLPACKLNSYADAARDSHVPSRGMMQTIDVDGKPVPLTAPAANFSRTPVRIRTRAPGIGQHNAEILTELGYDSEAIANLVAAGTIGPLPE